MFQLFDDFYFTVSDFCGMHWCLQLNLDLKLWSKKFKYHALM